MLVEVSGTLWHSAFPLPCWLQAMDSPQRSCYCNALQQMELQCSEIAARFARHQRLAMADGDAAVANAERGFVRRSTGLRTLHATCQVHRVAGVRSSVMSLVEPVVSSLIRTSLSLRFGSTMAVLRGEFRILVTECLRYERGGPPPEHTDRRDSLLAMFCPADDRSSKLRRAIVEVLCNGDWQGEALEH